MYIEVKRVGKIKEADIEIGDLTIFVGKNGTNKSYMAHIIYMLDKILNYFDSYRAYEFTRSFFSEFIKTLDFDIEQYFAKYKKHEYIRDIPIGDGENIFEIEQVREIIYEFDLDDLRKNILNKIYDFIMEYITKEINKSFNTDREIVETILFKEFRIYTDDFFENGILKIKVGDKISDSIIALFEIFRLVLKEFIKCKISKDGYYFPASRTGFVLTFDEIVSGVLRDRFGGKPTSTKLTEPTIDFISKFADIKSGKFDEDLLRSRFVSFENKKDINLKKVFDFINKKIIFGNIIEKKSEDNYTQFLLKPNNRDIDIEMHLTSSSVVELLPLIIFLKHFDSLENKLLVIEEPEAHFHPQAQIEIARLLIILVNLGAKVLITTHSDYILNEINNCIKLSQIPLDKQKEYLNKLELSKETVITKDRIKAYLFKDNIQEVEISKLKIDNYGISNENFDYILDELLDRTEYINMELKI